MLVVRQCLAPIAVRDHIPLVELGSALHAPPAAHAPPLPRIVRRARPELSWSEMYARLALLGMPRLEALLRAHYVRMGLMPWEAQMRV